MPEAGQWGCEGLRGRTAPDTCRGGSALRCRPQDRHSLGEERPSPLDSNPRRAQTLPTALQGNGADPTWTAAGIGGSNGGHADRCARPPRSPSPWLPIVPSRCLVCGGGATASRPAWAAAIGARPVSAMMGLPAGWRRPAGCQRRATPAAGYRAPTRGRTRTSGSRSVSRFHVHLAATHSR